MTFAISDAAFAYLKEQSGAISDLANDRAAWDAAYAKHVTAIYHSMIPYLPARARNILDIGSGLGGIDALLHAHYEGEPKIALVDGMIDAPVMNKHAETFSSMAAASKFLTANGVPLDHFSYYDPAHIRGEGHPAMGHPFDLIISCASYCFHYNPETYLEFVARCCHPETVLIFDVRREYRTWHYVLEERFARVAIAYEGKKFQRMVFRPHAAD